MRRLTLFALPLSLFASDRLGKPLTLKQPVTVAEVQARPNRYVGQTVQVKTR